MNRVIFYYYGAELSFDVDDARLDMFCDVVKGNGGELVSVERDVVRVTGKIDEEELERRIIEETKKEFSGDVKVEAVCWTKMTLAEAKNLASRG